MWLGPVGAPESDDPAAEPVVIEDALPAAAPGPRPLRGLRSRPRLPYGQGWRKAPDAVAPGPQAKAADDNVHSSGVPHNQATRHLHGQMMLLTWRW